IPSAACSRHTGRMKSAPTRTSSLAPSSTGLQACRVIAWLTACRLHEKSVTVQNAAVGARILALPCFREEPAMRSTIVSLVVAGITLGSVAARADAPSTDILVITSRGHHAAAPLRDS